jgi:hypothetical protein
MPTPLAQILANLLSNVEKYVPGGMVEFAATLDADLLAIVVSDEGPGIPAEAAERIFRPFERLDSRVNEGATGTGLGLAIARDLAERMGGSLRLIPSTRGATFELRVPAPPAARAPERFCSLIDNVRAAIRLLVFSLVLSDAIAAPPARPVVRNQLLAMLEENRAPLTAAASADTHGETSDPLGARHDRHRKALRSVLETIGWPTRELVGEDGERVALELLQAECTDVSLLERALQLLNAAVLRGAATKTDLARLVDAARVGQNRLQVYGTQYVRGLDGQLVRFPIENPDGVDQRRALVGLLPLRVQEMKMGLLAPSPSPKASRTSQFVPGATGLGSGSRLAPAKGLNSEGAPRLGVIYVHSRDDPRAPLGERSAPSTLSPSRLQRRAP